ncbi:daptide-type RiPP biosynthesis dehydogenase [Paenarthrobacter sp. NCHU4564]|uniref:daptide-type RiPP biosynthesis dehydogenase n=1 Tax=Paenarthrobacter sp. NCHU4564 TaxID=3451353 RepID=UPI003F985562
MIADKTWRTRSVILDAGMSPKYLHALTRGRTGLVLDPALGGQRDRLLAGDLRGAPILELPAGPVDTERVREVTAFVLAKGLRTVVGLGGGSVMDAVKLGALFSADPSLAVYVERHARRSGLMVVPAMAAPHERPRTVLMPSTIGTGAEVSAVACLDTAVGRRLLASRHLAADAAVLDAAHLADLPRHLLLEGLLEAFLRVAGTVAGSSASIFDDDAHLLLCRIVALGQRLTQEDSPGLRLSAARLSQETHTGWSLAGRDPYGAKHWYVANELAYHAGIRKMSATAAIIPAIWEEITRGAAAWGDARRLAALWSAVTGTDSSLPPNPALGIAELMRRWGLNQPTVVAHGTAQEAASSSIRNWGGVLPMLRGLTAAQVLQVLQPGEDPAGEDPASREQRAASNLPHATTPTARERR